MKPNLIGISLHRSHFFLHSAKGIVVYLWNLQENLEKEEPVVLAHDDLWHFRMADMHDFGGCPEIQF